MSLQCNNAPTTNNEKISPFLFHLEKSNASKRKKENEKIKYLSLFKSRQMIEEDACQCDKFVVAPIDPYSMRFVRCFERKEKNTKRTRNKEKFV